MRRRVRIGAPDPSVTRFSGVAAVTELVDRLNMIKLLGAVIGPIKTRDRGCGGAELLVGVATAQLAGAEFLVGLDRWRADAAGQVLAAARSNPRMGRHLIGAGACWLLGRHRRRRRVHEGSGRRGRLVHEPQDRVRGV